MVILLTGIVLSDAGLFMQFFIRYINKGAFYYLE